MCCQVAQNRTARDSLGCLLLSILYLKKLLEFPSSKAFKQVRINVLHNVPF